jgi:uncharacterized protein YqgV (UPF0045/DUF77 family)
VALIPQKQDNNSGKNEILLSALIALRNGDFNYRLPDNLTGIEGKIADTFNEIVAIENEATEEIERVSTEVGVEGRLNTRANLISTMALGRKRSTH